MLVLTRRTGEQIVLPDHSITITVVSVAGNKVRLGVEAPASVPVHRREVWRQADEHGLKDQTARPRGSCRGVSTAGERTVSHAPTSQDLEKEIAAAINERTGRRVKSLAVRILGDRVVLQGHAESYYAVQLAQAGLLEALRRLDMDLPERVELNIEIVPSAPNGR
jgi:carbon storage regulator CsrA